MYLQIALGVVLAIILYLYWIGLFSTLKLVKAKLKPREIMYYNFRGAYDKELGVEFGKINENINSDEITK